MKKFLVIALTLSIAFFLHACKSKVKDADIKASIEKTFATDPDLNGLSVDVVKGVATVSGTVNSETARVSVDTKVKNVKGVTSVVNNTTVVTIQPPVENSGDEALQKGLADALKDNPTVHSTVVDGKIVLTGEITKARWIALKQTLDKLMPKGYDLSGLKIN